MTFIRIISLALNDLSLEDYYSRFKGICAELNIYQPISTDIKATQKNVSVCMSLVSSLACLQLLIR